MQLAQRQTGILCIQSRVVVNNGSSPAGSQKLSCHAISQSAELLAASSTAASSDVLGLNTQIASSAAVALLLLLCSFCSEVSCRIPLLGMCSAVLSRGQAADTPAGIATSALVFCQPCIAYSTCTTCPACWLVLYMWQGSNPVASLSWHTVCRSLCIRALMSSSCAVGHENGWCCRFECRSRRAQLLHTQTHACPCQHPHLHHGLWKDFGPFLSGIFLWWRLWLV